MPTNVTIAQFWGVTDKTVKRWRANLAPVDNDELLAQWFMDNPRHQTDSVMLRLEKMGKLSGGSGADSAPIPAGAVDPDYEEFRRITQGQVDDDPKRAMAAIAKARSFAEFKFDRACAANNKADIKFYADLITKLDGTLHDQQLRAKKLGLDTGDLVPRAEVERIFRAWAWWAMRSIDGDLADLCPKLTGLSQVEDVRQIVEPALLSARFLRPFARATRIEAGVALPDWMVDTLKDAVDDYIEDGIKEFEVAKN